MAMCTSQPLFRVAPYEWCRKYLDGLEEVNGTITLSTGLFLSIIRKAYSDAYHGNSETAELYVGFFS